MPRSARPSLLRLLVALQVFLLVASLVAPIAALAEEPSADPSPSPTPSAEPSAEPTPEATPEATPEPTAEPTAESTPEATPEETAPPATPAPTAEPTAEPTPAEPVAAPTIASDLDDYPPGGLVTLTGSNWQPGEVVHIFVNDDWGSSWNRHVDVIADANGNITDQFNLPNWFVATVQRRRDRTDVRRRRRRASRTGASGSNRLALAANAAIHRLGPLQRRALRRKRRPAVGISAADRRQSARTSVRALTSPQSTLLHLPAQGISRGSTFDHWEDGNSETALNPGLT